MFKGKVIYLVLSLAVVAALLIGCAPGAQTGPAKEGPIVIGYVGTLSSPGVKPCVDAAALAVEEINAQGGVLGRPLKLVLEDSKGETSLAVAAVQRMLLSNKPIMYMVEGRSEIALAVKDVSANLYKEYPHLCVVNGAADYEVTEKIVSQYDKYKFFFRDYEFAQYPWFYNYNLTMFEKMKVKKIAVLYEDLYWTRVYREGGGPTGLPSFKDYAEKTRGFEVVYDKPIKARAGMWLPTLEAIAQTKPDVIFVYSSWFTDVEVLAKQWADSSAKDIPVLAEGGIIEGFQFWNITGGKCLGMLTTFWENPYPVTPVFPNLVKKAKERNIPLQTHVILAYNNVYFLKAVLDKVGKTTDMDAIIKGYETTVTESPIGPMGFNGEKEEPWFHSGKIADKKNPLDFIYPDKFLTPLAQWQGKDKVELIYGPPSAKSYMHPENYKTPAQLRTEAGVK
jgi:ABC-type branched-subunit amino acid transport system substrate-binding protein